MEMIRASRLALVPLQDAILTVWAHHLDAAYRFDPYVAIRKWRVDPLPHQVEFVAEAINLDPIRLLLADEVGLGKTIMACMIVSELMARGRVKRVLIVAPASLIGQWRQEMIEKFGLVDFSILTGADIDHEAIPERALVSLDTARKDGRPSILASCRWDMVIFDEAHKLSVPKAGAKRTKTKRYKLAERLCASARNILLLTATPHVGDDEDFEFRLRLLNPHVATGGDVSLLSTYTRDLLVRRLKEDVRGLDGSLIFPPRNVDLLRVTPLSEELEFHRAVEDYVKQYYKRALGNYAAQLALVVLLRRVSSSIHAGINSLRKRLERLKELKELLRKGLEVKKQDVSELLEEAEEALELDYIEDKLKVITPSRTEYELDEEIRALEQIVSAGEQLILTGSESKFTRVLEKVKELINDEKRKVIIFTEYRDTLYDLRGRLNDAGFSVVIIHGAMDMEARKASERALFDGQAQVLVATDAAGEGLNLQVASVIINYELPWNPMKLDQRLGRIHRYGQTRDVKMFNVAVEGTIEGFVMEKLMDKLDDIKKSLGTDKVFDVVGVLADDEIIRKVEECAFWDPVKAEEELEVLKERGRKMLEKLNLLTARHIEMVEVREKPPSPTEFIIAWATRKGLSYSVENDTVVVLRENSQFEVNVETPWKSRLFREAIEEFLSNDSLVSVARGTNADAIYVYTAGVKRAGEPLDSLMIAVAVKRDGSVKEVPLKTVYSLQNAGFAEVEIELPPEDKARELVRKRAEEVKRKVEEELAKWKMWREEALSREYEGKFKDIERLPRPLREGSLRRLLKDQENAFKRLEMETRLNIEEPRLVAAFVRAPYEEEVIEKDVEIAAMEAVMNYERHNGRRPTDVSKYNLGYDVKSSSAKEVRFIEVKGLKETGSIKLTLNEWKTAKQLKSRYWLYVVTNALDRPRIHFLRDPAAKLPVRRKETLRVVKEIAFVSEDWEKWVEREE